MKSRSKRWQAGFTLLELLAVIAIVAVVFLLATPVVKSIQESSMSVVCVGNMRQLSSYVLNYCFDHQGDILPVILYSDATKKSGEPWHFALDHEGYLPSSQWNGRKTSVMRCKAQQRLPEYWANGTRGLHYGLNEYPGFRNGFAPEERKVKLLEFDASRTLMFAEISAHYAIHPRSNAFRITPHKGGSNLVYFDGHAEFYSKPLPILSVTEPKGEGSKPFY